MPIYSTLQFAFISSNLWNLRYFTDIIKLEERRKRNPKFDGGINQDE